MLTKIHIFDLDGVLVDTSHRYRNKSDGSIDLTYWLSMRTAKNIAKDTLLPMAAQYKRDCENPEVYTIICTARNYNILDVEFIASRLGLPDKLIMKPAGDSRSDNDTIYKRRELQRLLNLRQFTGLTKRFWDDNIKNVYAISELGVQCFHIQSDIGAR